MRSAAKKAKQPASLVDKTTNERCFPPCPRCLHCQVVVVDGVGYPAVGSICGVSNGDVAAALNAPVLLVGKSGVGDAVDSYNLNACFFEARGVRVLGGVFNRISTTGYYSLERCREVCLWWF